MTKSDLLELSSFLIRWIITFWSLKSEKLTIGKMDFRKEFINTRVNHYFTIFLDTVYRFLGERKLKKFFFCMSHFIEISLILSKAKIIIFLIFLEIDPTNFSCFKFLQFSLWKKFTTNWYSLVSQTQCRGILTFRSGDYIPHDMG